MNTGNESVGHRGLLGFWETTRLTAALRAPSTRWRARSIGTGLISGEAVGADCVLSALSVAADFDSLDLVFSDFFIAYEFLAEDFCLYYRSC